MKINNREFILKLLPGPYYQGLKTLMQKWERKYEGTMESILDPHFWSYAFKVICLVLVPMMFVLLVAYDISNNKIFFILAVVVSIMLVLNLIFFLNWSLWLKTDIEKQENQSIRKIQKLLDILENTELPRTYVFEFINIDKKTKDSFWKKLQFNDLCSVARFHAVSLVQEVLEFESAAEQTSDRIERIFLTQEKNEAKAELKEFHEIGTTAGLLDPDLKGLYENAQRRIDEQQKIEIEKV